MKSVVLPRHLNLGKDSLHSVTYLLTQWQVRKPLIVTHHAMLSLGYVDQLTAACRGMAATDIVASFTGCAGQRCMAASLLVAVGEV